MKKRLSFIDATRGLMILLMLVDHVRETFLLHVQLADPMDVTTTSMGLYFERILSHLCAPMFVFLAGVSAFLYSQNRSLEDTRSFLFKRGLILILLELTVVNFAWTFQFPPARLFLQVIWATGLSMVILSFLLKMRHSVFIVLSLSLIVFHNLLDTITISKDQPILHIIWSIIHQRDSFDIGSTVARTSYPVLPWIGVIGLGWILGPIFLKEAKKRKTMILRLSFIGIALFIVLRALNFYGDQSLVLYDNAFLSLLSFFNLTKYPPSFLFVLLFLSLGLLLTLMVENLKETNRLKRMLALFGSVPMFFYILHLYILKFFYLASVGLFGLNKGDYFGFDSSLGMFMFSIFLIVLLYYPVKWFSSFKQKRKDLTWLKYF